MRLKLNWFSRWTWFWAAAGLVLGGIVHISAILALPYVSANSAWEQLRIDTPANAMQLLPPAAPDFQVLEMMAPDVHYALCRYDVAEGPVIMRTRLLQDSWSIALYTPLALNFYAVTKADLQRSDVTLVLTMAKGERASRMPLPKGASDRAITVAVPEPEGVLLVRAPLRSESYRPATEAALAQSTCRAVATGGA